MISFVYGRNVNLYFCPNVIKILIICVYSLIVRLLVFALLFLSKHPSDSGVLFQSSIEPIIVSSMKVKMEMNVNLMIFEKIHSF